MKPKKKRKKVAPVQSPPDPPGKPRKVRGVRVIGQAPRAPQPPQDPQAHPAPPEGALGVADAAREEDEASLPDPWPDLTNPGQERLRIAGYRPPDPGMGDFRNWLWRCWKFLRLPDPTPVQYDIAEWMQHGPKRQIIQAFRGVGKSYEAAAFSNWIHNWDPRMNIMVVSAGRDRAGNFTDFCMRLLTGMPETQHLAPHDNQRRSRLSYDVVLAPPSQNPSLVAKGINSQITGSRAHLIIVDDVETPQNSMTAQMREKLADLVREFDAVLMPNGRIIVLGTPQTEMSVYGVLEERGFVSRKWPARFVSMETIRENYGSTIAPMYLEAAEDPENIGKTADPLRFTDEDLTQRELSWGRSGWELQFMLNTRVSDAEKFPLKLADLVVYASDGSSAPPRIEHGKINPMDLPAVGLKGDRFYAPQHASPERVPFSFRQMSIDPAGRGASEIGSTIIGELNGTAWLLKVLGLRGGYTPENLEILAETAKLFSVQKTIIEDNFGDGMFTELYKPWVRKIHDHEIEEVKQGPITKDYRIIDTLEPVMNQHRLIVHPQVIEDDFRTVQKSTAGDALHYSIFWQMTHISREKASLPRYDRLDALAINIRGFLDRLGQDRDEAEKSRREALIDEQINAFIERHGGTRRSRWMKLPGDDRNDL